MSSEGQPPSSDSPSETQNPNRNEKIIDPSSSSDADHLRASVSHAYDLLSAKSSECDHLHGELNKQQTLLYALQDHLGKLSDRITELESDRTILLEKNRLLEKMLREKKVISFSEKEDVQRDVFFERLHTFASKNTNKRSSSSITNPKNESLIMKKNESIKSNNHTQAMTPETTAKIAENLPKLFNLTKDIRGVLREVEVQHKSLRNRQVSHEQKIHKSLEQLLSMIISEKKTKKQNNVMSGQNTKPVPILNEKDGGGGQRTPDESVVKNNTKKELLQSKALTQKQPTTTNATRSTNTTTRSTNTTQSPQQQQPISPVVSPGIAWQKTIEGKSTPPPAGGLQSFEVKSLIHRWSPIDEKRKFLLKWLQQCLELPPSQLVKMKGLQLSGLPKDIAHGFLHVLFPVIHQGNKQIILTVLKRTYTKKKKKRKSTIATQENKASSSMKIGNESGGTGTASSFDEDSSKTTSSKISERKEQKVTMERQQKQAEEHVFATPQSSPVPPKDSVTTSLTSHTMGSRRHSTGNNKLNGTRTTPMFFSPYERTPESGMVSSINNDSIGPGNKIVVTTTPVMQTPLGQRALLGSNSTAGQDRGSGQRSQSFSHDTRKVVSGLGSSGGSGIRRHTTRRRKLSLGERVKMRLLEERNKV
eukprot:g2762.t1